MATTSSHSDDPEGRLTMCPPLPPTSLLSHQERIPEAQGPARDTDGAASDHQRQRSRPPQKDRADGDQQDSDREEIGTACGRIAAMEAAMAPITAGPTPRMNALTHVARWTRLMAGMTDSIRTNEGRKIAAAATAAPATPAT